MISMTTARKLNIHQFLIPYLFFQIIIKFHNHQNLNECILLSLDIELYHNAIFSKDSLSN